jgi:membrane-bound ClpP family serine protease
MKLGLLIAILATVALLAAGVVVALYRHKQAGTGEIKLLGEIAQVDIDLDPEGTVIVGGELWRAKSSDGAFISARARVRVVGFQDHLVLVEVCD